MTNILYKMCSEVSALRHPFTYWFAKSNFGVCYENNDVEQVCVTRPTNGGGGLLSAVIVPSAFCVCHKNSVLFPAMRRIEGSHPQPQFEDRELSLSLLQRSIGNVTNTSSLRHDSVKRVIQRLAESGVIQLPPMVEVTNKSGQAEITRGASLREYPLSHTAGLINLNNISLLIFEVGGGVA